MNLSSSQNKDQTGLEKERATTTMDPLYTVMKMARLCCVCLELLNP